jgi:hypothetical protein
MIKPARLEAIICRGKKPSNSADMKSRLKEIKRARKIAAGSTLTVIKRILELGLILFQGAALAGRCTGARSITFSKAVP